MVRYSIKSLERLNLWLKSVIKKMQGGLFSRPKSISDAMRGEVKRELFDLGEDLEIRGKHLQNLSVLCKELGGKVKGYSQKDDIDLLTLLQIQNALDMILKGELKDFTEQEIIDSIQVVGNPKFDPWGARKKRTA